MNDIENRVAACFANVFPDLPAAEIPRASTASLSAWDSVAHITLLSSIAEDFNVELEMSDFDDLISYPLIVEYLKSRLGQ